ncbi:MAG: hypothetical protein CMM80_00580 [Rhodospirillaceae bacterium]|nr:hypothetical protein [Rhodospirillaceae bacterium]|tara:strand:- start:765 stop:986 length:222 start_codon:yes stop_codon:yes gene_type:complete
MQKSKLNQMGLSLDDWEMLAEQSGLDITQLEKQEIYQAYLRVQELVKRFDQIVGSEAEPAAVFLAENFSNEQH